MRKFTRFAALLAVAHVVPAASATDQKLDQATISAIRAAIEAPKVTGSWIAKPQFTVSPDRRSVAFVVEHADIASNTIKLALWLADTQGRRPPRFLCDLRGERKAEAAHSQFGAIDTTANPTFSPDGKSIAVVGFGPEGRLAVIDAQTGRARILTAKAPGAVSDVYLDVAWSPDGRFVAAEFNQRSAEPPPRQGVSVDVDWAGQLGETRSRIAVIDVARDQIVATTPQDLDVVGLAGAFSWSPDGTRLAFSARRGDAIAYNAKSTDLYAFEPARALVAPLLVQPGVDIDPQFSPDGRTILFLTDAGKPGWTGQKIGFLDVATGRQSWLAHSDATVRSGYAPSWLDNDRVAFVAAHRLSCPIFVGWRHTLAIRQLSPDDLSCMGAARPGPGGTLITTIRSFVTAGSLAVSSADRWNPKLLFDVRPAALPAATARTISWPSSDGRFTIHGILITPRDGRTGRRPLFVSVAGGPSMVTPDVYDEDAQHLIYPALLRGYAVLLPNTRGRGGYDTAFARGIADYQDEMAGPLSDVLAGVDHLGAQGLIDQNHMVLAGFSYGGALASYAAGHTDRFKAIMASEGAVQSLFRALQGFGSASELGLRELFGWTNPYDPVERARMFDESALESASKVRTPVLLECGALSLAPTDCLSFFRTVKRTTTTPIELVVYPRTGHGVFEAALRYDSALRQTLWLDRWLGREFFEPTRK